MVKKIIIPILCFVGGLIIAAFLSPGGGDQKFIDEIEARDLEISEMLEREKKLDGEIETLQESIDKLNLQLSGAMARHNKDKEKIDQLFSEVMEARKEKPGPRPYTKEESLTILMKTEIESLTKDLRNSFSLNMEYKRQIGLKDEKIDLLESRYNLMEENFRTQEKITKMWKKRAGKKWPHFVGGAVAATLTIILIRSLAGK